MLSLDEISIAFKGCNGESNSTFKDHLVSLNLATDDLNSGILITNSFNFILSDIEKLLDKAIINICSADYLIKDGFFNWGFVSSYYSNFFAIQALNRLQLDFHVWTDSNISCKVTNYVKQEIEVTKKDKSKNTHEIQYNQFFSNYASYRTSRGIDRFWNIGLNPSSDGQETQLRNNINYLISKDYYYELSIDLPLFKKIIQDNSKSPFDSRVAITDPKNYALNNLRLATCRTRILIYILNYIANKNIEYRSYYEKNMARRSKNLAAKYLDISDWLNKLLYEWLLYDDLNLESELLP